PQRQEAVATNGLDARTWFRASSGPGDMHVPGQRAVVSAVPARRESVAEAARGVRADRDVLEQPHARDAVGASRSHQLLDVSVLPACRVAIGHTPALEADGWPAVIGAVTPGGMRVAEALHDEGQFRLEADLALDGTARTDRDADGRSASRPG